MFVSSLPLRVMGCLLVLAADSLAKTAQDGIQHFYAIPLIPEEVGLLLLSK